MGKAAKSPASQQPQAVKQFRVQSSAWGGVIPCVYGEARIAGNIIAAWHFKATKTTGGLGSISSGKAAGGLGAFAQWNYHVALVLCLGEGGPSIPELLWTDANDHFDVGLATPGAQAVSTQNNGKDNIQPLAGIESGAWKAKRVLVLGEKNRKSGGYTWHHAAWREWASTRFISSVIVSGPSITAELLPPADFPAGIISDYTLAFGEQYKGLANMIAAQLGLGTNAGMANWNVPARLLCNAGDVYGGPSGFTPNDSTIAGVRDADPACILVDILANPKHGIGFWDGFLGSVGVGGYIDTLPDWPHPWGAGCTGTTTPTIAARADSWSAFCRANEILISPVFDTQAPAADVLKNLAEETQTAVVFSEGLLKMIPYSDVAASSGRTGVTYTPTTNPATYTTGAHIGVQYDLTIDDFLPGQNKDPVEIERKSVVPDHGSAGLFNDVRIEFQHRMNGYSTEIAQAKDEASIAAVGLLSAPTFTYHEITDPNLALDTATRHLQRLGQVRNIYRFTLGWRFARLEPMDVVTLPGEALAFQLTGQKIGVRITSVSEDKTGSLSFEAEDFPKAFASRAPEDTPTPPLTPTGGPTLVMNGAFTLKNTLLANPTYVDPQGLLTSDRAGVTSPPTANPVPVFVSFAQDVTISQWAVRCTRHTAFGGTGPVVAEATARFRLYIEGLGSQADGQQQFFWTETNVTKFGAPAITIPAGVRWCLELTYFDKYSNPFPAIAGDPVYADMAFAWQLLIEEAG